LYSQWIHEFILRCLSTQVIECKSTLLNTLFERGKAQRICTSVELSLAAGFLRCDFNLTRTFLRSLFFAPASAYSASVAKELP
jgi:hypothetical protein